jgi:phage-related minor tail protein
MSSKSLYVANTPSDADKFDRALDHIESRMKTAVAQIAADPHQLLITPEELKQIVTAAVNDAIARFELARNAKTEPARHATHATPLRLMPNMARLQDEMGLDDIEFDAVEQAPVTVVDLSNEAKAFVYQDPTDAALSEWDDALKRLSSDLETPTEPHEG